MTASNQVKGLFLSVLLLMMHAAVYANTDQEQVIRFNQSSYFEQDSDQQYFEQLLQLALQETVDDYGPFKLQPVTINMVQARALSMLQANEHVDVMWTMTSVARERDLQAIYVPLLKGLMGYRVFLIRKGEQARFSDIESLDALFQLRAGQGASWPDTAVLDYYQFPMYQSVGSLLYGMLEKRRFDYFPRAITEVLKEIEHYPQFQIEQKLMLRYFSPTYFFVNKSNQTLAKRLTLGLSRLIANGKFDRFFNQSRHISDLFEALDISNRRVFDLDNPYLTDATKALQKNDQLWLATSPPKIAND